MNNQKGTIPVLFLLAALGLLIFLFISNTFDFKNKLFSRLFPKPPSHAQEVSPSVPDEILLKFKPGVDEKAKDNIRKHFGIKKDSEISQIGVEIGKVSEKAKDKIIEALSHNPAIEFAEPNFFAKMQAVPNDPFLTTGPQWALTDQYVAKIGVQAAWDISKGSSTVIVADVDSGIKSDHEDLQEEIVPGYNFVDLNTDTTDVTGHGTAVAGVSSALTNNSKGVASLGWNTPVMPLRVVTPTGSASYANIAKAIIYAADNGAKIVNVSLGGSAASSTLQSGIDYAWGKGLVITAAAGNNGISYPVLYPAAANHVIGVGSISADDILSSATTSGPGLDIVAPGQNIWTTAADGTYGPSNGTSFASPHIAALAALIISANPSLTNQQVVDVIKNSAAKVGIYPYTDTDTSVKQDSCNGWNQYYGCGRIDAAKALSTATGTTPQPSPSPSPSSSPTPTPVPSDTTPPTVSITNPTGTTVKAGSKVNITVNASDTGSGIFRVEIYVNGSNKCTSALSSGPYVCPWSVPRKKNTQYTITAKAYDKVNNTQSANVNVTAQ